MFYVFCETFYDCTTVIRCETKEVVEAFLNSHDWGVDGATVFGIVEGREVEMVPVEKVKTWKVQVK